MTESARWMNTESQSQEHSCTLSITGLHCFCTTWNARCSAPPHLSFESILTHRTLRKPKNPQQVWLFFFLFWPMCPLKPCLWMKSIITIPGLLAKIDVQYFKTMSFTLQCEPDYQSRHLLCSVCKTRDVADNLWHVCAVKVGKWGSAPPLSLPLHVKG